MDYLDGKQWKTNDGNIETLRFIKGDQLLSVERYITEKRPKEFEKAKTNFAPMQHPTGPMGHNVPPPNQPYPPPNQPYTYPPYYAPPPNQKQH